MGGGYRLRWLDQPLLYDFNWRDLMVVVQHAPRSSALSLAVDGAEAVEWDLTRQLLATIADATNFLRWAKSDASDKPGARPPDPIPRPGVEKPGDHVETDSMDEDEALDFLGPRFSHLKSNE